ncbi:MAG: hypothetical protein QOE64_2108 [Frankiales bacterium]|jgi:hypothetical protein|nr:hypothetical protein [Frankiales bacterium]
MRLRARTAHIALAGLIVAVLATGVADAATGGNLLLGRSNIASGTTSLNNTGSGFALGLHTASAATPNLGVSNTAKISKLNADLLDGLDSFAFQRVNSVKVLKTPAAGDPQTSLLTISGLGSFGWACDSTSNEARLYFNKLSTVSVVEMTQQRTYDPPGGGTGDTTTTVLPLSVSSSQHQFAAVAGADAIGRWTIQLNGPTTRVYTATITLTYNSADLHPGFCFAQAASA